MLTGDRTRTSANPQADTFSWRKEERFRGPARNNPRWRSRRAKPSTWRCLRLSRKRRGGAGSQRCSDPTNRSKFGATTKVVSPSPRTVATTPARSTSTSGITTSGIPSSKVWLSWST
uniref:(northern house mosquito) hypothetical protein n=1 Tax=Culex pipiens TaxID=7175 RepID=A0A8D8IHY6_CULPI